jgi:hypothetical protein
MLLVLAAAFAMPAPSEAANVRCTEAAKSTWLSAAAVKKMLQDHGFTDIGAVKANDGNCYVVQANDQSGAKRTLYLDPTSGALMALE